MSDGKSYIGDSVYAEIEDGVLKLTTDNGTGPTNTIYLDQDVYLSLLRHVAEMAFGGDQ